MKSKRCSKCGLAKPAGEFRRSARSKDGLYSSCKICHDKVVDSWRKSNRERIRRQSADWQRRRRTSDPAYREKLRKKNRDYYSSHKEQHAERARRRYEANREAILKRAKVLIRAWRLANPEKQRERVRRWREAHPEAWREIRRRARERRRKVKLEFEILALIGELTR